MHISRYNFRSSILVKLHNPYLTLVIIDFVLIIFPGLSPFIVGPDDPNWCSRCCVGWVPQFGIQKAINCSSGK